MRLEVGKTYRDRSGEFITIVGPSGVAGFPFDGRDGTGYVATYREDGTFNDSHSEFDLVEEYVPAVETSAPEKMSESSSQVISSGYKPVKAYRVVLYVIDHEGMGRDAIRGELQNARYINPSVESIEAADIGEWDDNHPLNKSGRKWSDYFSE